MKAQYVGDIGDFGKVLLLNRLAGIGFKIGVNWMLTKNDGTNAREDRNYVDYRDVDCLCHCDLSLIEGIGPLARLKRPQRRIGDLENLIRKFSKDTVFYSEYFDDKMARGDRDKGAFDMLTTDKANLVFFDPDNGISGELSRSPYHEYRSELRHYWDRGQSLLIYHHLSKNKPHPEAIEDLTKRLQELPKVHVKPYHFRRGTARVFMLCLQPQHSARVSDPEKVDSLAPLLVSKSEWSKLRRITGKFCAEEHPWY